MFKCEKNYYTLYEYQIFYLILRSNTIKYLLSHLDFVSFQYVPSQHFSPCKLILFIRKQHNFLIIIKIDGEV